MICHWLANWGTKESQRYNSVQVQRPDNQSDGRKDLRPSSSTQAKEGMNSVHLHFLFFQTPNGLDDALPNLLY